MIRPKVINTIAHMAVLEKLPASQFKRIHRSQIISTEKVRSVLNRKVKLASGTELAVSDSYADFIREWKSGE